MNIYQRVIAKFTDQKLWDTIIPIVDEAKLLGQDVDVYKRGQGLWPHSVPRGEYLLTLYSPESKETMKTKLYKILS